LPNTLFADISLSEVLGIERDKLGINYDIFSEGVYWFGFDWGFIYTIFLGFLCVWPYHVVNKIWKSNAPSFMSLAILISVIYMLLGGMVFPLRPGSRFVLALVLMAYAYSFCKNIIFRNKKYM
jgi:hypothetical protein